VLTEGDKSAIERGLLLHIDRNALFPIGAEHSDRDTSSSVAARDIGEPDIVLAWRDRVRLKRQRLLPFAHVLIMDIAAADVRPGVFGNLPGADLMGCGIIDNDA